MKKCRYFLGGMLVFLCLFGSCSGGIDPGRSKPLEEEGIEEKLKDPDKDDEDEMNEDDMGDIEGTPEIPLPAVFILCKTLPEDEIVFEFSDSVLFVSLNFDQNLEYDIIEDEGSIVKIKLAKNPGPGMLVKADLHVIDEYNNSISEQVTFRTRNDRVPKLQINEIRTEYSKPNVEFIEFKIREEGNLGALRVYIAGNYINPLIYEFAPVEVKKDEYVVLYLRTLDESNGTDSSPTTRDFWIPGSSKLLHKTDAVYVLDQDDRVLDAVIISENSSSLWSSKYIAAAAEFLFSKGIWKSPEGTACSPMDAVNSSNSTVTQTICRDETVENTHTKANWYITGKSCATPGKENNQKRL